MRNVKEIGRRMLPLVLCMLAVPAYAATAILTGQRIGLSVTGQSIWICTYMYGGSKFERAFPASEICPMSVEVY